MIVVGTSLGGMKALQSVLGGLPASFPLPVAVVIHRHRDTDDFLAAFMQKSCALPVKEAVDKDPIEPGKVYFAPADYHLLVDGDTFSLSIDEVVQYARPSIDVLFESAAESRGAEVIGVILTGANYDGAAGARKVVEMGGRLVVENPATAACGVLPAAVINAVRPDHICELGEIAALLARLGGGRSRKS